MSNKMTAAEALKAVRNATIYHSKRYPMPTTLMPDGGGYFIDDAVFDGLVAALPTLRAAVEERDDLREMLLDAYEWFEHAIGHDGAPDGGDPAWVGDAISAIASDAHPMDRGEVAYSKVRGLRGLRTALAEAVRLLEWCANVMAGNSRAGGPVCESGLESVDCQKEARAFVAQHSTEGT